MLCVSLGLILYFGPLVSYRERLKTGLYSGRQRDQRHSMEAVELGREGGHGEAEWRGTGFSHGMVRKG